jgi:hypothetical protein
LQRLTGAVHGRPPSAALPRATSLVEEAGLAGGQIQQRAQGVRIEAGILVEQQLRLLRSTLTSGKRWPRASIAPSSEALSTTITASGCQWLA